MKLVREKLDFEKTVGYFVEHIEREYAFDRVLLEQISFEGGVFYIYLPEGARGEKLYEFGSGWVNPPVEDGDESSIRECGLSLERSATLSTKGEIAEFIRGYVCKNEQCIAFCQDGVQERTDPPEEIPNVDLCFHHEEVYYVVTPRASSEEIKWTLSRTDNVWHSLTVLSSCGPLPKELGTLEFLAVCEGAEYILTSCHDRENYLVWQRSVDGCDLLGLGGG